VVIAIINVWATRCRRNKRQYSGLRQGCCRHQVLLHARTARQQLHHCRQQHSVVVQRSLERRRCDDELDQRLIAIIFNHLERVFAVVDFTVAACILHRPSWYASLSLCCIGFKLSDAFGRTGRYVNTVEMMRLDVTNIYGQRYLSVYCSLYEYLSLKAYNGTG